MTHEEHWDFERSGQMNLLFRPFRGAAPFTVRSTPDFENTNGMEWNRTLSARTQHVTQLIFT